MGYILLNRTTRERHEPLVNLLGYWKDLLLPLRSIRIHLQVVSDWLKNPYKW